MNSIEPITRNERIESIDVLRGVAVLGILALNIRAFAMPSSAYLNPYSYGDLNGINYVIWYVTQLLGDMKFWSIFSMLFGAGIIIMSDRCEKSGRSAAKLHYKRVAWLLLIGIIHAHFIWNGDILYTYAMCGFVVFLFRKWAPWKLIALGIAVLSVAFLISLGFGALLNSEAGDQMRLEMEGGWAPTEEEIDKELEIYRGPWLAQFLDRSQKAIFFETFLFAINFGWRSAGLILIGMALYKLNVFSTVRSHRFYTGMLAIAIFVGLPLIAFGIYQNDQHNWSVEYSFFFGPLYNYWASILVALGWVAGVMLICKSNRLSGFTKPFAAAGRMALSCYLMESLIATTIFYGHGFGWFGYLERWQLLLVVIAIWVFLLVFSTLWMSKFRFGPFEWVWRSLTYWKRQPMLKNSE